MTLNPISGTSQGCSDAGLCSIGSLNNSNSTSNIYSSLSLKNVIGLGEASGSFIYLHAIHLEAKLKVSDASYFNVSLPLKTAFGNLGSVVSVGDLATSFNLNVLAAGRRKLIITVGTIIPTNDADLTEDGRPLPMIYQSSLGSLDLIGGVSYFFRSWHIALGYQHPLGRSENEFLHDAWPSDTKAENYFESSRLKRGDDLMLRIQKAFTKNDRTIFVGILPILRLQKDEIIRNGQIEKLDRSDQLTLNLNFGYRFKFKERTYLGFTYANPVIWRKTRADGLTRPVVISAGIEYIL